jgi:hypothetical protein
MRRLPAVIATVYILIASAPVWAHGDPEELGHHWDIAAYRNEMWFQTLVMLAAMAVYVAGVFAVRAWKRRNTYR